MTLSALLMIPMLAGTAPAQGPSAKARERAMKALFGGPKVKKLRLRGHQFNIYPAKIQKRGSQVVMSGRMSHHLRWRPDDQITYRIVKRNGVVTSMKVKINRGGFAKLAGRYWKYLKLLNPKTALVKKGTVVSTMRKLGRLVDGNWGSASSYILATAALRLDSQGKDSLSSGSRTKRSSRGRYRRDRRSKRLRRRSFRRRGYRRRGGE
ncbi:MAG: hypothetical protein CMJ83_09575 [Planctomycetes bacterium]|nr:hypothetical protein [Planctomycetota bacterium]